MKPMPRGRPSGTPRPKTRPGALVDARLLAGYTGSKAAQQTKEIDIAVGLDRKADQVIQFPQGRIEGFVVALDRFF